MFERKTDKNVIDIWVGTVLKPSTLYKLVLNLRRKTKKKKDTEDNVLNDDDDLPILDDLENTSVKEPKTKNNETNLYKR